MADFDPPFADSNLEKRDPDATEQSNGFGCGPADINLFNGMFHAIQAELNNLIVTAGGLTPDAGNLTQVVEAIQVMIDAAIGGGPGPGYVTFDIADSRLPIYPETQSADFKINCTSPAAGTVRIPGGVNVLYRGITIRTTVQTDFTTAVSSTYHLRYNLDSETYGLQDLADIVYNPGALTEDDPTFDSTYDDVLVARIVTNSSNVAIITNLANRGVLFHNETIFGVNTSNPGDNDATFDFASLEYNWARTPQGLSNMIVRRISSDNADSDFAIIPYTATDGAIVLDGFPVSRYNSQWGILYDYTDGLNYQISYSV